jgi:hypothetical protein
MSRHVNALILLKFRDNNKCLILYDIFEISVQMVKIVKNRSLRILGKVSERPLQEQGYVLSWCSMENLPGRMKLGETGRADDPASVLTFLLEVISAVTQRLLSSSRSLEMCLAWPLDPACSLGAFDSPSYPECLSIYRSRPDTFRELLCCSRARHLI